MTTTPHGQVPAIQRYKIGYHSDEWGVRSSTPSGIYDDAGPWVRYEDHVIALAAGQATAAQQGVAYAALPEPITYQIAVLKACEHGDALVGWRVEPSRQSFDASMRPKRKLYTEGDMRAFADATHALRASHGQAPAGAGMGHTDGGRNMFYEGRFDGESKREQQARLRWANDMRAAFERHTGNGWFDKDWRTETGLWSSAWHACLAAQPTTTAQAAESVLEDALPREDFAWLVVQEACETEPADEDDPECVRILRRDLKSSVLAAFLRLDAARAAQEGKSCPKE